MVAKKARSLPKISFIIYSHKGYPGFQTPDTQPSKKPPSETNDKKLILSLYYFPKPTFLNRPLPMRNSSQKQFPIFCHKY